MQQRIGETSELVQYADDTMMYTAHGNIEEAISILENEINKHINFFSVIVRLLMLAKQKSFSASLRKTMRTKIIPYGCNEMAKICESTWTVFSLIKMEFEIFFEKRLLGSKHFTHCVMLHQLTLDFCSLMLYLHYSAVLHNLSSSAAVLLYSSVKYIAFSKVLKVFNF